MGSSDKNILLYTPLKIFYSQNLILGLDGDRNCVDLNTFDVLS